MESYVRATSRRWRPTGDHDGSSAPARVMPNAVGSAREIVRIPEARGFDVIANEISVASLDQRPVTALRPASEIVNEITGAGGDTRRKPQPTTVYVGASAKGRHYPAICYPLEEGFEMKKFARITVAVAAALVGPVFGLAPITAATPTNTGSAQDTVNTLQGQGFNVALNGSRTAPLSDCLVAGIHPEPGTAVAAQFNTVWVDISCPPTNN
jgi:hypothetical protein